MRLADFILRNMEGILADWEAFAAAQLPAASNMQSLALRDHAQQMLEAAAHDIQSPQTRDEQVQKSLGRATQTVGVAKTAAQTHAHLRARSGFDIVQLAGEFRALRTSVLRRWADACEPAATDLQDMIRFNEAIDQAIVESVSAFTVHTDQARNFFLGMLGHDMRSPLSTVQLSAGYIAKRTAEDDISTAASRIVRSSKRMEALLNDLLDFNRIRFGLGLNINPSEFDLSDEVADEMQQLRAAHPGLSIALAVDGDVRGVWDAHRIDQVLGNLVSNAVRYGDPDAPVRVVLTGRPAEVILAVKNRGPMIEKSYLAQIFDPLQRGPEHQAGSGREGNLGLGLYISREIVVAHGGTIDAQSDETETVFTVRLPRTTAGTITKNDDRV